MSAANQYDVVVIGGGPGGSTASAFVAMQGHKVLLLERERFPRHRIGESLLPATVQGVCVMLGVEEELKQANFYKKYGATFRWGKRPDLWSFRFGESKLMEGRPDWAYQVERAKFDQILLDNARKKGVDVRTEALVGDVIFENGRAVGVKWTDAEGREQESRARFIVDAGGSRSLVAGRIGERIYDKFFLNVALYGYYKGGRRLDGDSRGNIICAAFNDGWFWYIPLTEELTSVGAVVAREKSAQIRELGMEKAMERFIDACPIMKDMLSKAERITDDPLYGELRIVRDYSYNNSKFWAPGCVLVGDAACFIDPVFSSGVHLATYAGLLAARSINSILRDGLDEARAFAEYEVRYRREFGVFYEFLVGFYEMHQDEESYFWRARKVLSVEESNKEAFVQLVAGLSATGEPLFQSPDSFADSARCAGSVLQQMSNAQGGGELAAETRAEVNRRGSIFFRERFQFWEMYAKKHGKALPEKFQATMSLPIVAGGLIPTPDGMHWQEARPVPSP